MRMLSQKGYVFRSQIMAVTAAVLPATTVRKGVLEGCQRSLVAFRDVFWLGMEFGLLSVEYLRGLCQRANVQLCGLAFVAAGRRDD